MIDKEFKITTLNNGKKVLTIVFSEKIRLIKHIFLC